MENMKLVDQKIIEMGELYARQDKTKDIVNLDPYEFTRWDGALVKDSISVTRNTPAWQAFTIVNKLIKIKWQPVVESSAKLSKSKISDIERFTNDVWAQVDEYLADKDGTAGGLDSWVADQLVKRGLAGARFWLKYDSDGNLVIDCVPVDMRWMPFEHNEWYCPISLRTSEWLEKEYGDKWKKNKPGLWQGLWDGLTSAFTTKGSATYHEVRNFWDGKKEEIYINGRLIDENENIFGSPPFVTVATSRGSTFRDRGYIKWAHETFDFLDRDLYEKSNQLASISQSLAFRTLFPGYEQASDKVDKSAPADPAPGTAQVIRTDVPHTKLEYGELNNSFLKASQIIETDIQAGGVTQMETGTSEAPNTALLVTTNSELLREKLKPEIDAMAVFKQKATRLIIDQYIKLSEGNSKEVELGVQGVKHGFSAAQLGEPATYRITYRPMMVSREQNIANTAVANAQRDILPRRFILQDTLQVEDVEGMIRDLDMEKAKELDPSIAMFEMALSYAVEAKELSDMDADVKKAMSRMLTESGVLLMRQRGQVGQTPKLPEVKPNTQGLLALTGPGGNGQSAKVTAEV